MSNEPKVIYVTLAISEREEGLRIRGMGDLAEVYVSGPSKKNVFHDLGPVLQEILYHNHGATWLKDKPE